MEKGIRIGEERGEKMMLDIIRLLGAGKSVQEIAKELKITQSKVLSIKNTIDELGLF